MQVVVVSWTAVTARARATARHALTLPATVTVLDVDGSYRPAGEEAVLRPDDVALAEPDLRRDAATSGTARLGRRAAAALTRHVRAARPDDVVLTAAPGVLLLAPPRAMVDAARTAGLAVVARDAGPVPPDAHHPDDEDLLASGLYEPALVATGPALPDDATARWAATDDPRWLDVLVATTPHAVVRDPAVLVGGWTVRPTHRFAPAPDSAGRLTLDGEPVAAVDLSQVDDAAPWLLDPDLPSPRALLSDHPALAALVAEQTGGWAAEPPAEGSWDPDRTGFGAPLDPVLRRAARLPGAPDLLDPATGESAQAWLVGEGAGGGLPPYLTALRGRPDLTAAFPRVPGGDEAAFLAWARTHAVADGAPAELVEPALAAAGARPAPSASATPGRPRPGVNVVGFLGAELGIGESARLLVRALQAQAVPCSTTSVDRFSQSRATADAPAADSTTEVFDTTVVCVNSDLTPTVAPAVADLLDRSYRVGMWYWEVEDFPPSQHGGFAVLDEIWVATDFVRSAVEPHSPLPVRTLMPPLPQRSGEQPPPREQLGLPDRPYLLFSFDFLSTAERKNPMGLLAAFTRAFAPDEGPLLVIKSINADKRPAQAERLRLAAAGRPDVILLEQHLPAAARDALVAHCAAYVSLHRSEGLGLTMAEAMAWGRPVVATRYSGNLQFMDDANSFLVPWTPTTVPAGAAPYPPGGRWADPDLDEAARLLRVVWDEPDVAAARGARAARDIATKHTVEVAGAAIAARLAELASARRARARRAVVASGKQAVERLGRRLLR